VRPPCVCTEPLAWPSNLTAVKAAQGVSLMAATTRQQLEGRIDRYLDALSEGIHGSYPLNRDAGLFPRESLLRASTGLAVAVS
jgi:hypothetical protein